MEHDNFDENGIWNKSPVSMWANDSEHLLDNAEFLDILGGCLENLPDAWRSVITLKYFEHKKERKSVRY